MASPNQACDARKDQCGIGKACVDSQCVDALSKIRVGLPCATDAQCETNACVSLPDAVARHAGLSAPPRVCDVPRDQPQSHVRVYDLI